MLENTAWYIVTLNENYTSMEWEPMHSHNQSATTVELIPALLEAREAEYQEREGGNPYISFPKWLSAFYQVEAAWPWIIEAWHLSTRNRWVKAHRLASSQISTPLKTANVGDEIAIPHYQAFERHARASSPLRQAINIQAWNSPPARHRIIVALWNRSEMLADSLMTILKSGSESGPILLAHLNSCTMTPPAHRILGISGEM